MKNDEKALFEMKSDEKALFEMKSDEKALSDEELKSFVVDEGGLDCSRQRSGKKKKPGFAAKPKRGAPMQFEIFRNLRSRKRKKNLLSELQLLTRTFRSPVAIGRRRFKKRLDLKSSAKIRVIAITSTRSRRSIILTVREVLGGSSLL